MASVKKVRIKTTSVRECRFYMRYILNHFRTLDREYTIDNFSDTEICCRIINQHIRNICTTDSGIEECINNLEFQYLRSIIQEDNFLWLKENKRATFWVWGELALNGEMNKEINKSIGMPLNKYWYKDANLYSSPINHEQRYNSIVDVIDFICSYSPLYTTKIITWINNQLILWRKAQKDIIQVDWVTPENEKDSLWAYNYIKDYQIKNKISENDNFFPVNIPTPLSAEEVCLSFYALHDLWNTTLEKSKEVNERMLKTHNQSVWRRNNAEKKMLSQISDVNCEKLKFLSEHYKITEMDVLNILIEDRFKGVSMTINKNLSG